MLLDGWTLVFQIINFLLLVWLLQRFLFQPVKRIVEARRVQVHERLEAAERSSAEADDQRRHYEALTSDLTQERQQLLKKLHDEFAVEAEGLLRAAHDEADRIRGEMEAEVENERKAALELLQNQIFDLAAELARMLLVDIQPGALSNLFLQKLIKHIAEMGEEERDHLAVSTMQSGGHISVITSSELSVESQGKWAESLDELLGEVLDVQFEVDASLLGGAFVRFPHAGIDVTWRTMLRHARSAVNGQ